MVQALKTRDEQRKQKEVSPPSAIPSQSAFKNSLSFSSIKDKQIVSQHIEDMKKRTIEATKSIHNIPGVSIPTEREIGKIFSELQKNLQNIKTKQDEKDFFKQYSLIARMSQSYIEASANLQKIKETALDLASFYFGIDSNAVNKRSSAIISSAFIVASFSPLGPMKGIKQLTNAEKLKNLERTAPATAKALSRLAEKLRESEKAVEEAIQKEKAFLKSLAALSKSKPSFVGLKGIDEIEQFFMKPSTISFLKKTPTEAERRKFIMKNLFDDASLVIKKTDPADVARTKTFLKEFRDVYLNPSSGTMISTINRFLKSGGTQEELIQILEALIIRVRYAGHGATKLWEKNLSNNVYYDFVHDYKNVLQTVQGYKEILETTKI